MYSYENIRHTGKRESNMSRNLKTASLNAFGCSSTLEGKRVIGKMLVEQKFDVLALSETKLKRKGECEFGCVSGMMSGEIRGRAREGATWP